MIIEIGDVVLVSHRRMFERDEVRYFIGRTLACEGPLLKAQGFSFVRDLSNGHIIKKLERRIKIISLDSPGHIVYQLPHDINIDKLDIDSGNGDAFILDGTRRVLNLSEHTHCGHI